MPAAAHPPMPDSPSPSSAACRWVRKPAINVQVANRYDGPKPEPLRGRRSYGLRSRWRVFDELVRPRDEVLHVRGIRVPAVVLAPRQFAIQQANVDAGHLFRPIVVR